MTLPRLRLYSRVYCHLCDDMRAALEQLRRTQPFELEEYDVDADPVLEERYDVLVPVVADGEGNPLCHHFFDPVPVGEYLGRFG